MSTRTRTAQRTEEDTFLYDEQTLDLEALDDDELEALLFEEESDKPKGLFNLPTVAGLSIIMVGIAYIFQQLGILGGAID